MTHSAWQPAGQMIHHLAVSAPGAPLLEEINEEFQSQHSSLRKIETERILSEGKSSRLSIFSLHTESSALDQNYVCYSVT